MAKKSTRPKAEPIEVDLDTLSVEVPIITGLDGYEARRVDARMDRATAAKVKGIRQGLEAKGAKLADGARVNTTSRTVLYILQKLA